MYAIRLSNGDEYALEFVGGLPACYTCTNCEQFLGEPYQNVECGDRFCTECVGLITSGTKQCPQCSAVMTRETTFVDAAVRREIDGLEVCCPFKRYDCEQTLLYGNAEEHIEACSKNPVRIDASAANVPSAARTACEIRFGKLEKMVQDVQLMLDGLNNQVSSLVLWKCNNTMSAGDGGAGVAPKMGEMARRLGRWLEKQLRSFVFWKSNSTISSGDDSVGAARQYGEIARRFQTPEEIAQGASPVLGNIRDYGVLLWKIDHFRLKKKEAVDGVRRAIYSPPFHSYQGYKMGAYVYLNGDGTGLGDHLSPFFFLMKGEHDALLDFPFHLRVKFTLMDQVSFSRNLSDSFDPDPTLMAFQRPTSPRNFSFGFPRFVRQSVVETRTYLKDDCIILRISVESD